MSNLSLLTNKNEAIYKASVQSEYSDTVNKCLSRPILKSKVNKHKK